MHTEADRKQEEDRMYFGTQHVTLRVADGIPIFEVARVYIHFLQEKA
jgi:hypothetical protein